jgi:hypothetical protein
MPPCGLPFRRRIPGATRCVAVVAVVALLSAATVGAQSRTIRVMGNDGLPVPYAAVWLDRARPRIADADGIVTIPENVHGALTVDVARLGYQPVQTPVDVPEHSAELTLTLPRLRVALQAMQIIERANPNVLEQTGFYRRALEHQRTSNGAFFFTPEELERRGLARVTQLFESIPGVTLRRRASGGLVVTSRTGTCTLGVMLDGVGVHPTDDGASAQSMASTSSTRRRTAPAQMDSTAVLVDNLVGPGAILAVEVYPRGSSLPSEMQATATSCGVVAIWTGARR